jgi:hypothetical protein
MMSGNLYLVHAPPFFSFWLPGIMLRHLMRAKTEDVACSLVGQRAGCCKLCCSSYSTLSRHKRQKATGALEFLALSHQQPQLALDHARPSDMQLHKSASEDEFGLKCVQCGVAVHLPAAAPPRILAACFLSHRGPSLSLPACPFPICAGWGLLYTRPRHRRP